MGLVEPKKRERVCEFFYRQYETDPAVSEILRDRQTYNLVLGLLTQVSP